MPFTKLIAEYLAGPHLLQQAVIGMTDEQLDARPILGAWSTRQVICHIADFEPVYADRMKRVIAEEEPTFFGGDPDVFAARLAYDDRDVSEELKLIEFTRRQLARILKSLPPDSFHRKGNHFDDGLLSLEVLLSRITSHIPHHIRFINEKRRTMRS